MRKIAPRPKKLKKKRKKKSMKHWRRWRWQNGSSKIFKNLRKFLEKRNFWNENRQKSTSRRIIWRNWTGLLDAKRWFSEKRRLKNAWKNSEQTLKNKMTNFLKRRKNSAKRWKPSKVFCKKLPKKTRRKLILICGKEGSAYMTRPSKKTPNLLTCKFRQTNHPKSLPKKRRGLNAKLPLRTIWTSLSRKIPEWLTKSTVLNWKFSSWKKMKKNFRITKPNNKKLKFWRTSRLFWKKNLLKHRNSKKRLSRSMRTSRVNGPSCRSTNWPSCSNREKLARFAAVWSIQALHLAMKRPFPWRKIKWKKQRKNMTKPLPMLQRKRPRQMPNQKSSANVKLTFWRR